MVAIDMEMPKYCSECSLLLGVSGEQCCVITGVPEFRIKDCPLVEIVTCKDCKHCDFDDSDQTFFCNTYGNIVCSSHFCSNGERRE